jgi:hypothetical protein
MNTVSLVLISLVPLALQCLGQQVIVFTNVTVIDGTSQAGKN